MMELINFVKINDRKISHGKSWEYVACCWVDLDQFNIFVMVSQSWLKCPQTARLSFRLLDGQISKDPQEVKSLENEHGTPKKML